MSKPACGDIRSSSFGFSSDKVVLLMGFVGTLFGILAKLNPAWAIGILESVVPYLGPFADLAPGLAGGGLMFGVVTLSYWERCRLEVHARKCMSGVVERLVDAFSDLKQRAFPWLSEHPRFELVVKSRDWEELRRGDRVFCSGKPMGGPEPGSPLIWCFLHDDAVCAAGLGAMVGAAVGGVAGAVIGAAALVALCAFGGAVCALGILVAFLSGVLGATGGATIGGHIGRAVADSQRATTTAGVPLRVGDLVAVIGDIHKEERFGDAVVYWFADPDKLYADENIAGAMGPPFDWHNAEYSRNGVEWQDACKWEREQGDQPPPG